MAKRSFRTKMRLKNGKQVFVIRDKKGRFKDIQNIGRSLKADRRVKAKTTVKSGQGFRGDLKRRKRTSPMTLELMPRTFTKKPSPPRFKKRGKSNQTFFNVFER